MEPFTPPTMSDDRLPTWLEPRTAYVHVPFCGHHCGYCDFAVTAGQDSLIPSYLEALELELRGLGRPRPVETLFIGGGTPTYLDAESLRRLMTMLRDWLPVTGAEFSIESTPESLSPEKVRILSEFGVNRVSIGVQSFQAHSLRALDRRHGVEQIPRAVEWVRERISQLSFDLIFASPGQTLDDWKRDLDEALAYQPDHLSTYGLTYEKGTPLWKQRERGLLLPVVEDSELAMYLHSIDRLGASGFEHYEISNFAKPGRRSIHNQRYWANDAYYGFGVGAARYIGGVRELNVRSTKEYIRRVQAGESPVFQSECLEPRERAFETVGTQLRRMEGIDRREFQNRTGFDLDALLGERLAVLVANDMLSDNGLSLRLTRRGVCLADAVIEELMKGAA